MTERRASGNLRLTEYQYGIWHLAMNAATISYRPKAKVPFAHQLAREFGLEATHVLRVCRGERASPRRDQLLARQLQLLEAAKEQPNAPQRAGIVRINTAAESES